MKDRSTLGRLGEECAARFLMSKGMEILHRNWRHGKLEIDLVAKLQDCLVIVEVKSRSSDEFGEPEYAVNGRKRNALRRAAEEYIETSGHACETRFDIVAVEFTQAGRVHNMHHIPDAFYFYH